VVYILNVFLTIVWPNGPKPRLLSPGPCAWQWRTNTDSSEGSRFGFVRPMTNAHAHGNVVSNWTAVRTTEKDDDDIDDFDD
jgi:hypothetical protein